MPTNCIEEVRAQIEEALGVKDVEWWLEEAVRVIQAHRALVERRRVYDVSTVGARLRTAREIVGLSQDQLALRLKHPQWSITRIERGKADAPLDVFARWCLCVGITQAWALGDSDEGGPPMPGGILRKQKHIDHNKRTYREQKKVQAQHELERVRGLRPPRKRREDGLLPPDPPAPAPRLPPREPCPRCGDLLYGTVCVADGCGYPGAPWTPGWAASKQDHEGKSP